MPSPEKWPTASDYARCAHPILRRRGGVRVRTPPHLVIDEFRYVTFSSVLITATTTSTIVIVTVIVIVIADIFSFVFEDVETATTI